ncbi:MAG: hypothetical protein ABIR91_04675 [Candidatus Saccharimonadales bacterium]
MSEIMTTPIGVPWFKSEDLTLLRAEIDAAEYDMNVKLASYDSTKLRMESIRSRLVIYASKLGSRVLAVGYPIVDGSVEPHPCVVESNSVKVRAVKTIEIGSQHRVVVDCEIPAVDQSDEVQRFALQPLGILHAESLIPPEQIMGNCVYESQQSANEVLDNPTFYDWSAADQHRYLADTVSKQFMDNYRYHFGDAQNVAIVCTTLFVCDDTDTTTLQVVPADDRGWTVRGTVTGAIHLQSIFTPLPRIASKDDVMFNGIPCMVITNNVDEQIFYVPLSEVKRFFRISE